MLIWRNWRDRCALVSAKPARIVPLSFAPRILCNSFAPLADVSRGIGISTRGST